MYNIAMTGRTGVGKSSLINVIVGANVAKEGDTECTMKIEKYSSPKMPNLQLWDLPGAGSKTHPAESYATDKKLYAFDLLLLVVDNRYTQTDALIIEMAKKEFKIPVAIVRSKSDADLRNRSEDQNKEVAAIKQAYKQEILAYLKREVPDMLKNDPIFLISKKVFTHPKQYEQYTLDEAEFFKFIEKLKK